MTVDYINHDPATGHVRAPVRWDRLPGIMFVLELSPDGRLVEFSARAGEGSVSARTLRRAPIGEMQRAVRAEVLAIVESRRRRQLGRSDERRQGWAIAVRQRMTANVEELARDFVDRDRPGAAGRKDAHYAAIAAMYVELFQAGDPTPVGTLAEQLHLGDKTIRNYLFLARKRDLLTSLGRGKAGGELTDKAREILSGDHQAP